MIDILFDILPFALGIAVSPVPIITVILSLFSLRAKWNGPAFILGWALGILVVCIPVLIFTDINKVSTITAPSTFASITRVILGMLLLILAIRRWRKRPKSGEDVDMPKWLQMIHKISPVKVFGIGFFFADLTNPKNTALTIAGTLPIAHSALSMEGKFTMVTAFTLVACVGVAIPVIFYFVGGEAANKTLAQWKSWLISNNSAVMATMFLIFGVILFSKGIQGLIN